LSRKWRLDEVLEELAAVRVAPGKGANQREVLLDQPLARLEVAALVIAAKKLAVGFLLREGHP
jgi:hypothetical protein